jgi:pentatricopeptide repeat protein
MATVIQSALDIFSAVTQELTVILVFFLSLALWKHIGNRQKASKQQKKLSSHPSQPVLAKKAVLEQRDEVVDPKTLLAVQSAETQMMKLLEQREFTRALNFFRTFERDGRERHFSEALFSAFIQSSIRVGKIDVVERLVRSMKRRGAEPSRDFWRTTLKMLSSRKHFDACLSIYTIFGRSLPSDKIIFSCLINGALESGASERASQMLERYCEADLEPRDHVLLFRTYVAIGDIDAAEKTFRSLGEEMSALMLNLLLLTCVQAKQPERALERLHEAHQLQETRNSKLVNPQDAEVIVDVVSYNTVIKGFAQAGLLPRCFDCLHEMKAHNLEPDDVTFGTLLDMCIADNDMSAANEVVDLLVRGDRPVDTVMCTLFIKGLVRAQRLPKAMELYEEMKRRNCEGARPDIVTYSVLIKAFVDAHDLERALLLVEDMTAAGHTPDDIILTHLLEGCRYVGNHALGKRLFEDMLAAGVKPSDFTLITMVKLHGRCGAHGEAYQLVANWERQHGMKPSVIHHTCLMSGCLRTKNYDQAWQAYQLMIETKVMPDETTMATLIPGMVAAQQWDRTIQLIKFALKSTPAIPVAAETLNNALAQMRVASGQSLLAMQLQTMMQEANIPVTNRNPRRLP